MKIKSSFLLIIQFIALCSLYAKSHTKKPAPPPSKIKIPTLNQTLKTTGTKKIARSTKVVTINMPKCGTHLLLKCISLLGNPKLQSGYNNINHIRPNAMQWKRLNQINQFDPPMHYKGPLHVPTAGPIPKQFAAAFNSNYSLLWTHMTYTAEAEEFLNKKNSLANFFIIRDPRAMLVSMAHMVKDGWHGEHANVEDIIWDFIDGRQKHFIRWGVTVNIAYPLIWELGVTDFYKLYLPWMKAKNFYTVRFENLIGAKGGGSDEIQLQEINNIARHIGMNLSAEQITSIRNKLFGGSITFREGKIDGWKKHFTPEMITAYKETPGACQLLIDLGYEKDTNW